MVASDPSCGPRKWSCYREIPSNKKKPCRSRWRYMVTINNPCIQVQSGKILTHVPVDHIDVPTLIIGIYMHVCTCIYSKLWTITIVYRTYVFHPPPLPTDSFQEREWGRARRVYAWLRGCLTERWIAGITLALVIKRPGSWRALSNSGTRAKGWGEV